MDITLFVGNVALVVTIASNFAGMPICREMVRKKSTLGKSIMPFFAAAINSSLWFQYGLLTDDRVQSTVNAVSLALQCCYVGCFSYAAARDKGDLIFRLLTPTAIFLLLLLLRHFCLATGDRATLVQAVGLLASCGSVANCAAPLATIMEVLRSRSTESLPFLIIFGSFWVSALWCTYGRLIGDSYVQVPNFIGTVLCAFQLILFVLFDSKSKNIGQRDLKE